LNLLAEPLQVESFAPFGDVLEAPKEPGRVYFSANLNNGLSGAAPSLSVAHVQPLARLPLVATRMERHEFSSQSFIPLNVGRWLVIVAPQLTHSRPDTANVRAFLAGPGQRRHLSVEYLASSALRPGSAGELCHFHVARGKQ